MRSFSVAVLTVLSVVTTARSEPQVDRVPQPTSAPAGEPFAHRLIVRNDPRVRLHVVTIDLADPRLTLHAPAAGADPGDGFWKTRLDTVRRVAERDRLDVAINGDYFYVPPDGPDNEQRYYVGNLARVCGIAMSDGRLWSDLMDEPSLIVHHDRRVTIEKLPSIPSDAHNIISSDLILVQDGRNVARGTADPAYNSRQHTTVQPRAAVGIDAAGRTMYIVVVDGRRPEFSDGITLADLGDELRTLGAHSALNLDGGGSATLVLRDPRTRVHQVYNRPADGYRDSLTFERPVANVLGVRVAR